MMFPLEVEPEALDGEVVQGARGGDAFGGRHAEVAGVRSDRSCNRGPGEGVAGSNDRTIVRM